MNCEQCVKDCRDDGQTCAPRDPDHVHWYEQWMYDVEDEHVLTAHVSTLIGGFYRCPAGKHDPVEAKPAEAMRAAGMRPML